MAGSRAIDGFVLLQELRSGKAASGFLTQADNIVDAAGNEFMEWFDRVYGQSRNENTWHPQHLEYQPQIAFAESDSQASVFRKEEYYGEGIEWHGFSPKN